MLAPITASISQRGVTHLLSADPGDIEIEEGSALLTITAPSNARVYFNDTAIECVWRPRESLGVSYIDLTNQVGFHRIRVVCGAHESLFDFATSTAKATLEEIRKMAEICANHYLGYRKQFTYASRSGEIRKVIVPQIIFGWFRERIPEIESLVSNIIRRPATELRKKFSTSLKAKGVSIPATVKLLHERPNLLEARHDGPIRIADIAYWPSAVRVREADQIPAPTEHAQISLFIKSLLFGIESLRQTVDVSLFHELDSWRVRLTALRESAFLQAYKDIQCSSIYGQLPTAIQRRDSRYRRIRELAHEYQSDIGATGSHKNAIRANVQDAWHIYQTFVAHVVGEALNLEHLSANKDLRARATDGASMIRDTTRLFFDQKPPRAALPSWRDESDRPGYERPDLVVIDQKLKRVILMDAKFKVAEGDLRAKAEDIFEMQGYLNSFNICAGGVVFPGKIPAARIIEGRGNKIVEMPLRAQFYNLLGGVDAVHEYVRLSLAPLWTTLNTP